MAYLKGHSIRTTEKALPLVAIHLTSESGAQRIGFGRQISNGKCDNIGRGGPTIYCTNDHSYQEDSGNVVKQLM